LLIIFVFNKQVKVHLEEIYSNLEKNTSLLHILGK